MNIDILKKWFEVNKDNYIDVIIAGRVFGGRHGESPQLPRAFSYRDDILKVKFSTTEHLTVINPTNFILGQYSQLLIPVASKAVWVGITMEDPKLKKIGVKKSIICMAKQ